MNAGRAGLGVAALGVLLLAGSCTHRSPASSGASAGILDGTPGHSALYRARVEPGAGRSRKFRVLLFVAEPDRLHAEVLTPLGSTALVADAGRGRISIAAVRSRTAYVGDAGGDVFGQLLGVDVAAEQLVAALLGTALPGTADASGGAVVRRVGPPAPSLPDTLEIEQGGNRLLLELRRRRVPGPGSAALGTGDAPPGFDVRPLAELGDAVAAEIPEEDVGR